MKKVSGPYDRSCRFCGGGAMGSARGVGFAVHMSRGFFTQRGPPRTGHRSTASLTDLIARAPGEMLFRRRAQNAPQR